ncbi:MAG: hypothetical protein AAF587_19065 [Bacteroidota bacterium]
MIYLKKPQQFTWPLFILFMGSWMGCSLLDQPEELPVYLHLQPAKVWLDSTRNISAPAGVKDLWIDHNGQTLGVHRLPKVIPILMEEPNRLTFAGGIFENGLSSIRARYPFWIPQTVNLSAASLDTIPYTFTFSYYPDTVITYAFNETFEEASTRLSASLSGNNQANLTVSSLESFQGSFSGRVSLGPGAHSFEAIANEFIALPQTGTNDIYMEISYKNSIPFSAGVLYITTNGSAIGDLNHGLVYQSDTWNTVYIHINDQVRSIGATALFKPYIRASSLDNSSGEVNSGEIFLDNIRIIHFR